MSQSPRFRRPSTVSLLLGLALVLAPAAIVLLSRDTGDDRSDVTPSIPSPEPAEPAAVTPVAEAMPPQPAPTPAPVTPAVHGSPLAVTVRVRPKLLDAYVPEITAVEADDSLSQKKPLPPSDFDRLVLAVELNEEAPGDMFVVRKDGAFYLRESDVLASGVQAKKLPARKLFDDISHVPASKLGDVAFDEFTGTLTITAPAQVFPTTVVNFGRSRPKEADEPMSGNSLFVNYALSLHGLRPAFSGELGATVGPAFISTTVSATPERGFVRGLTQVIFDDPRRMQRWTLGDAWARTGVLGGGALVGGLQFARRFELDPYFVRQPLLAYDTDALFASTMDVYVNGNLVRSQSVGPGPLRLENLSAPLGLGQTRVVLRDDFGRQREIARTHYLSSGVLAAGVDDYAFTAGFERERFGLSSFDYAGPVLLGSYRRGLSDLLTGGLRAEASMSLASGGATVTARLPVGEVSLAGAASVHDGRAGWAASGVYTFLSRSIGATAHARFLSPDYTTVGQSSVRRATVDAGGSIQVPLGRALTVSAQAGFLSTLETGNELRTSLLVTSRLNDWLSLHATAMTSHTQTRPAEVEMFISLNALLGPRTSVSGWHRRNQQTATSGTDIARSLPAGSGLGYRVRAQTGDRTLADGRFEYQGAYGRSYLQLGHDGEQVRVGGGVAGSLVLLGGDVHATRPIDKGFALIRLPGAPDVRGYMNGQEIGRTDSSGDLLVPGLLPHYVNRLSINQSDLPAQSVLATTERAAVPRFRGGGVIEFGVRRLRAARGLVFVRQSGKALPATYGELVVQVAADRQLRSPLGRGGEFELDDISAGTFPAQVQHVLGTCHFYLEIPPGREDDGITDLGRVECLEEETM